MTRLLLALPLGVGAAVSAYTFACVAWVSRGRSVTAHRWRWDGPLRRRLPAPAIRDRSGVYIHLRVLPPIPLYVGLTIDGDNRMNTHGRDIRSLFYRWCLFIHADEADIKRLEYDLIGLFPWTRKLGFQTQRGRAG